MKKIILLLLPLALGAAKCEAPQSPSSFPAVATACSAVSLENLNTAWRAYDAALDAINLLIDVKAIVPGSAKAKAIANGNDAVLTAFKTAEHARAICDASSYKAALDQAQTGLADIRAALHRSN